MGDRLKGKVAVISGSSMGIGRALAVDMAKEGADIIVNARNVDKCKEVVAEIEALGRKAVPVAADISIKEQAENLKVGWSLERHVTDGDITLFNRQPSLHRISMMAHEIKVLPGRTFRLNPVTVSPYNADFDGDEMNLHVMQTAEAQAEARYLAKVDGQLLSPRHGHAIIKPQEDHVSGLYFLTNDEAVFTKDEAATMFYHVGLTELPKPNVSGGRYSGKLLFSQLLPDDLSLKMDSKLGDKIIIRAGKLTSGAVESKAMEGELLEKIFVAHGPAFTKNFLDSATKMALFAFSTTVMTTSSVAEFPSVSVTFNRTVKLSTLPPSSSERMVKLVIG